MEVYARNSIIDCIVQNIVVYFASMKISVIDGEIMRYKTESGYKMDNLDFVKETVATHDEIVEAAKRIAGQIESDYEGKPFTLLCVLKGSLPITAELMKHIKRTNYDVEFLRASSYEGSSTESKGIVDLSCNTFEDIEGKNMIIVEDILDTGRTLQAVYDYLYAKKVASVKTVTLLDKPERRVVDIEADYVGFTIPDYFVIGFGLDYDEEYRGLKDIYIPYPEKL